MKKYPVSIIKKTFEFCSKYKSEPFKDITHPIDSVTLPNYYNDYFEKLDNGTLIQIISLADFLHIDPLLQLICFKVSYWLRDMSVHDRLQFFQLTTPQNDYTADL